MKLSAAALIVLFGALTGCMRETNPSVVRSTVMIEVAKRGEMQTPAGLLKDVVYVEKPVFCDSNTDKILFVVDADERGATQVKAHLGQCADKYAEVQHGLKTGDRVIVSDMSQYELWQRIDLR